MPTSDTINSTGTWVAPNGVVSVDVECYGGGAGGGISTGGEGGGGGGAYAKKTISVTPESSYTVTVGTGGAPNVDGGSSWFSTSGTVLGVGGSKGSARTGGAGGAAGSCIGDIVRSGGAGGTSSGTGAGGAGGGSSAGTGANGNAGSPNSVGVGGAGGTAPTNGFAGGGGGNNLFPGSTPAGPASGGGGGGAGESAGSGANGRVIVTYELDRTFLPSPAVNVTAVPSPAILASPDANAGVDITVCEGSTAQLAGVSNIHNVITWTTDGDGTFNDDNILNAVYTPGAADIAAGECGLTLTVTGWVADQATDSLTLGIQHPPTSDAGANQNIGEEDTCQLAGIATNSTVFLWETAGDGTFDDDSILAAEYTPGAADKVAGTVVLTLTVEATSPCAVDDTDTMTITIQNMPNVNAGSDVSTCGAVAKLLNATVSNHSSVLWTTPTDGTFDDPTLVDATYTPTATDVNAGSVILTLTAQPIPPCDIPGSDTMTLTCQAAPTCNAGADATICSSATAQLDATVTNNGTVTWSSAGDGGFNNVNTVDAIYTPGAADIAAGTVVLTLSAAAVSPCATPAVDTVTLTIVAAATSDAGADQVVFNEAVVTLAGVVTNATSHTWFTAGDGVFSNAAALNSTYTAGVADIVAGFVVLTLTAYGTSPCGNPTNTMTITLVDPPVVNAGPDQRIESGNDCQLAGVVTGEDSLSWDTSGDGTFDDDTSENAIYAPGAADITAGEVTLTLTAINDTLPLADTMILRVMSVTAGADKNTFGGIPVALSGATPGAASALWSTAGDGTFSNVNNPAATYSPGPADIEAGTVVLTLTGYSNEIGPFTDTMTVTIATINAGPNQRVDGFIAVEVILDGDIGDYETLRWTTSGDGVFNDPEAAGATYTLGINDVANPENDMVVLTLTAKGNGPELVDSMIVRFNAIALADSLQRPIRYYYAGNDVVMQPTVRHGTPKWTTAGDGTFADNEIAAAIYTPGAEDIANGSVILTLIVTDSDAAETDPSLLTMALLPTVNAGPNQVKTDGSPIQLDGAVDHETAFLWTSSGTGSFNNDMALNAVYTPSAADIASGSVLLTLEASGSNDGVSSDSMVARYAGDEVPVGKHGRFSRARG